MMDENNASNIYSVFCEWIMQKIIDRETVIMAVLSAFFVSMLRSFLYGEYHSKKRIIAEATLCSLICYAIEPVLVEYQVTQRLIIPISVFIGFIGTHKLQEVLLFFIDKKWVYPNDQKK